MDRPGAKTGSQRRSDLRSAEEYCTVSIRRQAGIFALQSRVRRYFNSDARRSRLLDRENRRPGITGEELIERRGLHIPFVKNDAIAKRD